MKKETKKLIDEAIKKAKATNDIQLIMCVLEMYKTILDLTLENNELRRGMASSDIECDGSVIIEINGEEIAEAIQEKIRRSL